MVRSILTFVNLLLAALVVGTMFGIWLAGNPTDLSPGAYVEQQQHAIRALNVTVPILGRLLAVATAAATLLARGKRRCLVLLAGALACFVAAGTVTHYLNQPINAIVMTWSADAPPHQWTQLRDEWWRWHVLRTIAGISGLSLLIAANLIGDRGQAQSGGDQPVHEIRG